MRTSRGTFQFFLLLLVTLILTGCSGTDQDTPDIPPVDASQGICPGPEGDSENSKILVLGDSMLAINAGTCCNVASWLRLFTGQKIVDRSANSRLVTCDYPNCTDINHAYNLGVESFPNIRTVILNGGANDLFVEWNRSEQVEEDLIALLQSMLDDGMETILYLRYYELLGIAASIMNPTVDTLMEGIQCSTPNSGRLEGNRKSPAGISGLRTLTGILDEALHEDHSREWIEAPGWIRGQSPADQYVRVPIGPVKRNETRRARNRADATIVPVKW